MVDPLTTTIGIILALITTTCFNLAIVFQKKGLNSAPNIDIEGGIKGIIASFRALFKNRWWLAGTLLGIFGWFPYIISIGMVGVLVTEPVMASGFLVFVVAAVKILDEKIHLWEYIAIALLIISPILIALSGISGVDFDMVAFVPRLLLFLSITLSISFFSFIMTKKTRGSSTEPLFMMLCGAILFALGGTFTNILARSMIVAEVEFTWYILFEIIFGIFWFDYFHLWVFLGFWGMAFMNITSVAFYQGAIQKGKAVVMYPILDTLALIIPLFAGLYVFGQTFDNALLFWLAVIFAMIGSLILSRFQAEIETIGMEDGDTLTSLKELVSKTESDDDNDEKSK